MQDLNLMPEKYQVRAKQNLSGNFTEEDKARVIADYIAGMTDRFAQQEYERL